jgi:DNA polymerase I-like protein with 3'-5' exonuclease and polymerase domains
VDSEAAIAFNVQADAHGHLKDAILRMEAHGWLEKYNLINIVHDDTWFDCPDGLVDECMENVQREMERPSTVLVNEVAPEGLACKVSVSVGPNLAEMRETEG